MYDTATFVIVLCPCCASSLDARPQEEPQQFDCVGCGQTWTMTVDADRHQRHAL